MISGAYSILPEAWCVHRGSAPHRPTILFSAHRTPRLPSPLQPRHVRLDRV